MGSYFVGQYYQVLQQQPDLIHQFYSEPSRAIRIDGDSTETANTLLVNKSCSQDPIFYSNSFGSRGLVELKLIKICALLNLVVEVYSDVN